MDPYSVAKGSVLALKDLYLLSKYVHKTIKGMQSKDADWIVLKDKFQHELTVLNQFGQMFLLNNNTMDETVASQDCLLWLKDAKVILERQCGLFAEFRQLASDEDTTYLQHSSIANEDPGQLQLGLVWELDDNESTDPEPPASGDLQIDGQKGTQGTLKRRLLDLKFVLFQKKKLEDLLQKFREETSRLNDLVPFIMATHPRYRPIRLEDARTGQEQLARQISHGMASLSLQFHEHVRRRLLPSNEYSPIDIPGEVRTRDELLKTDAFRVEPEEASVLTSGSLHNPSSGAVSQVLLEYKSILSSPDLQRFTDHGSPSQPPTNTAETASAETTSAESNIHNLALLLSSGGNPNFHTLRLQGYIHQPTKQRYAFIFDYPFSDCDRSQPISLHSILFPASQDGINYKNLISLPHRFHIAYTISKALASFHTDGWVHKSIRSTSIVFFKRLHPTLDYDNPYLVSFEYSRPVDGLTHGIEDNNITNNIYRHPQRQGAPTSDFTRIHDIYALGVVLLEVGCYKTALEIYKEYYKEDAVMNSVRRAKKAFEETAEKILPHTMGLDFANAVKVCLSGKLADVQEQTNFGLIFMEEVVKKLSIENLRSGQGS
ncbi:hypothetical protein DL95DRAFT_527169 [Leptodontidium sp. 2 PMI_412]|nr:hypothetical protein DL95DRAFT_527169 [Leptodontidium sp. 2 PMI_412]